MDDRKPEEGVIYASLPELDPDLVESYQEYLDSLQFQNGIEVSDIIPNLENPSEQIVLRESNDGSGGPVISFEYIPGVAAVEENNPVPRITSSLYPAIFNDISSRTPSIQLQFSPSPTPPSLQFHPSPTFGEALSPANSFGSHLSPKYRSSPSPDPSIVYHPSPSFTPLFGSSPSPVPSLRYHPSPSSSLAASPRLNPRIDLPISPQHSPSPVPSLRYHPSPSPSSVGFVPSGSQSSGSIKEGRTSPITTTVYDSIDPNLLFHPKPRSSANLINLYNNLNWSVEGSASKASPREIIGDEVKDDSEKVYQCRVCNLDFTKDDWQSHLRTHKV